MGTFKTNMIKIFKNFQPDKTLNFKCYFESMNGEKIEMSTTDDTTKFADSPEERENKKKVC